MESYPFVSRYAALCEPQPQSRVGMVNLHSLHQALKRCQRPADVQQLNTTVIQQLIALVG